MHELLALAADTDAGGSDGTLIGSIIAGVVTIVVAVIARWQKKKKPPILSPAEQAANLNYRNVVQDLKDLRGEFARYKTDTEESEGKYRRQVGVEMDELRDSIDFKDVVINVLDDEVLDLRRGIDAKEYPPLPPRRPRPRRSGP